jgi:hypothetical protein
MPGELVPELHDIGKMVDNDRVNTALQGLDLDSHSFTCADHRTVPLEASGLPLPRTATWQGIVAHHEGAGPRTQLQQCVADLNQAPQLLRRRELRELADLYCLVLADHLSASTSRAFVRALSKWQIPSSAVVHKLWRYPETEALPGGRYPVESADDLRNLLDWLGADPSAEEFLRRFDGYLRAIPEEKGFPNAVTSLRTHCLLVGKYHRVLRRHTVLDERQRALVYAGQAQKTYGDMERTWAFRLVRCEVAVPHRPARSRDLGVFKRLEAVFDSLEADPERRDYLLMRTLDTMWLFAPVESERALADLLAPLLEAGFPVRSRALTRPLTDLARNAGRLARSGTGVDGDLAVSTLYGQLPTEIAPPLCAQCQLAPGDRAWSDTRSGIEEPLCLSCYRTRVEYGDSFRRLARWEDEGAGVAWLRLGLDDAALGSLLPSLFERYLKRRARERGGHTGDLDQVVAGLRPLALTVDFTDDYLVLLDAFGREVRSAFGEGAVEGLTARRQELLVVALERPRDVLRLAELFWQTLQRYFPACPAEAPISLAISIGNAKHPFFLHWRDLQPDGSKPPALVARGAGLRISLSGGGRLEAPLAVLPALAEVARQPARRLNTLHNLAAVARLSESLATVMAEDRDNRDVQELWRSLRPHGLSYQSLLTLARLAKE